MNKPVAWMLTDRVVSSVPIEGAIPLYTHPVKEHFEDEPQGEELYEILQSNTHPVKEKGLPLSSPSPMNQACLTSNDNYMTDDEIWAVANDYFAVKSHYVTDFARAILRKAQEK